MSNIDNWCQSLTNFWQQKDINKIIDLFDQNVIYYEEPNHKISFNELKNVWSEIKDEDMIKNIIKEVIDKCPDDLKFFDESIKKNILVENNNRCVANFLLHGNTTIDMIYEIEINKENKCNYLKQWYMEY